jgi:type IV secretory pathway TraG/TraD family ATPase VirD4
MSKISYFGESNGRLPIRPVGIYQEDRFQHMYVIGKTGTGKSTLLFNLMLQDVKAGRGFIFLDPHGDLAEKLVSHISGIDTERLIYFDIPRSSGIYGYNPLKNVKPDMIPLAASGLLDTFRLHFGEKAWGARMEHIFRNVLYALLEYGDANLLDILKMLDSKEYRKEVLRKVKNPQVQYFFKEEFGKLNPRYIAEAIAPIQSKVGAYLTDPRIVKTLIKFETEVSFRRAMDERKIVIVNLARGSIGGDTAHLLGSLLVSTLTLAALSRTNTKEEKRVPAFIYLDEFEHLLTGTVASLLSEIRKMKVGLTLAHQYLYQLPDSIRAAVLGNVGTIISFRIGVDDAHTIAKELTPVFDAETLVQLANYDMCVKLMIEGEPSVGFSAKSSLTMCHVVK